MIIYETEQSDLEEKTTKVEGKTKEDMPKDEGIQLTEDIDHNKKSDEDIQFPENIDHNEKSDTDQDGNVKESVNSEQNEQVKSISDQDDYIEDIKESEEDEEQLHFSPISSPKSEKSSNKGTTSESE